MIHFLRRQKHTRNERELPHKNMSAYALNTVEGLKYLGKKFTLVNVQISSANATSLDFDLSNCIACQQDLLRSVKRPRLQVTQIAKTKTPGTHTKTSFSRRVGTGISTILNSCGFEYLQAKQKVVFSTEGQQLHLNQSMCSHTGEPSWSWERTPFLPLCEVNFLLRKLFVRVG